MISVFPRLNPKITLLHASVSIDGTEMLNQGIQTRQRTRQQGGQPTAIPHSMPAHQPSEIIMSTAPEHQQLDTDTPTQQTGHRKIQQQQNQRSFLFKTESFMGNLNPKHALPSNFINRL